MHYYGYCQCSGRKGEGEAGIDPRCPFVCLLFYLCLIDSAIAVAEDEQKNERVAEKQRDLFMKNYLTHWMYVGGTGHLYRGTFEPRSYNL